MNSRNNEQLGTSARKGKRANSRSRPLTRTRRIIYALVLVLIPLLFLEGFAFVFLYSRPGLFDIALVHSNERYKRLGEAIERTLENRPNALAEFDPVLGWRPRPNLDNGLDIINAFRLRSERQYTHRPAPNVLRIAAFGDSFVYGSEVSTNEAWPTLLQQNRANTEVLNYGVPGYGPDQAYLRLLLEGRDLNPHIVLFGVSTPSLHRILMVSSAFRSTSPNFVSKPRFVLNVAGELVLVPNPLRDPADLRRYLQGPSTIHELGELDYWYDPMVHNNWLFDYSYAARMFFAGWYSISRRFIDPERPLVGAPGRGVFNKSSSAFRILTQILDSFVETVHDWGGRPIVVILPDGYAVERLRKGMPGILDPVRQYCRAKHIEFIDLMEGFVNLPVDIPTDVWFMGRFHYSAEGNRVVADWIDGELERRGLIIKDAELDLSTPTFPAK